VYSVYIPSLSTFYHYSCEKYPNIAPDMTRIVCYSVEL